MPIFMMSEYDIKFALFMEIRSITGLVVMFPLELVVDDALVTSANYSSN